MFIDAHNHLDFYGNNLSYVLDMIRENSIKTLACSMDEASYLFTRELSKENEYIIPCFGIHPWKAYENHKELDRFDEYIRESRVIGEIGLDYYWVLEKERYPYMVKVFKYFLAKAGEYNKLTNIHTKGAEIEILEFLRKYSLRNPIIHWYSGPMDVFRKLLDYGCYFTISVDIESSELTKEIVEALPLDRILTETDGPNALEWVNGKYGYPVEVKNIVKQISLIKGIHYDEVKDEILNNFNIIMDDY
ncbi:TatD family hydrolase [Clostridium cylindrosporum]|uniref:Mg-dependent dnase n=1 Tax=Clostridium cylindrosporum DSM 605 TaxID=1121307 RepID=A0A0J8G6M5_CLOCY|nr:TatD family hydrolase [Clostridium cylindrosporum]KMT23256.1 Mg-dependent dnase [Clostridium cylindrosporum DSM 605]